MLETFNIVLYIHIWWGRYTDDVGAIYNQSFSYYYLVSSYTDEHALSKTIWCASCYIMILSGWSWMQVVWCMCDTTLNNPHLLTSVWSCWGYQQWARTVHLSIVFPNFSVYCVDSSRLRLRAVSAVGKSRGGTSKLHWWGQFLRFYLRRVYLSKSNVPWGP